MAILNIDLEKRMVKMRSIIIYIAVLVSTNVNATVINVGDTTLASNWNANGAILNITGKISGAYQISNAIIQANSFIQIFDTSVTLGTGIQCDNFSAMWYGAKTSNADNFVYLQKAITACQDRGFWLVFPSGTFTISLPLMSVKGSYGNYQQTQIKMRGTGGSWGDIGTQIYYTGDSCALGLQLNKGSIVKDMRFTGKWVSPSFPDSIYYSLSADQYTNQSASGGNGNGIWIDPIGNWNQRSGSTGCQFINLTIEKFTSLIKVGNGITQNDEIMLFENIQFGDGKYGIQSTQPQEKGNILRDIYSWGRIHTIYQITSGANYYIDGANIAGGCVRLFDIDCSGWFQSGIKNVYAENFGTIGIITGSLPIEVSTCVFDLSTASKNTLLSSGSYTKFNSCQFRFYGNSNPLKFSGAGTFDNGFFSGTATGMTNPIFTNYSNGTINTTGIKTITVTTDTIKTNSVKMQLRKSYLPE